MIWKLSYLLPIVVWPMKTVFTIFIHPVSLSWSHQPKEWKVEEICNVLYDTVAEIKTSKMNNYFICEKWGSFLPLEGDYKVWAFRISYFRYQESTLIINKKLVIQCFKWRTNIATYFNGKTTFCFKFWRFTILLFFIY